ncbi:LemA family protein [Psychrosphaera ytuae]|uniref:LemA family protein n=1 Tax=Psychrosphaera ytuae TaxID=2820710 RepID=A0A975DC05_9GAMM|nr:LemA family protein [Psychrosphaera ytuae]QTH63536.1 LemA family protein [Psychrosphaera ytuae]
MDISNIIALGLLVVVVLYLISVFNKLVALKNQFKNGFAQIEVQLKRRHDLIPNLVETAKGYMAHEKETLENVIAARNSAASGLSKAASEATNASAMKELGGAESALSGALGRLNVVMEDYPDLKANQNMMQLTEELSSTENRVGFARQAYNDQVLAYNTYKQSFPQNILAGIFGHAADASLLEFEDSAAIQAAPKVSF